MDDSTSTAELSGLGFSHLAVRLQPIVGLRDSAVVAIEARVSAQQNSPLHDSSHLDAAAATMGIANLIDDMRWEGAIKAIEDAKTSQSELAQLAQSVPVLVPLHPDSIVETDSIPQHEDCVAALDINASELVRDPSRCVVAAHKAHSLGMPIMLTDIGTDPRVHALLPFVNADYLRISDGVLSEDNLVDLSVIFAAVGVEAQRTGAMVGVDRVSSEQQRAVAQWSGATVGQGKFLTDLASEHSFTVQRWHRGESKKIDGLDTGVFQVLSRDSLVRVATKKELIAMSKRIEDVALASGEASVVAGAFQDRGYFPAKTAKQWDRLGSTCGFVVVAGAGFESSPVGRVRGCDLDTDDPLCWEWHVGFISPTNAMLLSARDRGDNVVESQRTFDYINTFDRTMVVNSISTILSRLDHDEAGVESQIPRWKVEGDDYQATKD